MFTLNARRILQANLYISFFEIAICRFIVNEFQTVPKGFLKILLSSIWQRRDRFCRYLDASKYVQLVKGPTTMWRFELLFVDENSLWRDNGTVIKVPLANDDELKMAPLLKLVIMMMRTRLRNKWKFVTVKYQTLQLLVQFKDLLSGSSAYYNNLSIGSSLFNCVILSFTLSVD